MTVVAAVFCSGCGGVSTPGGPTVGTDTIHEEATDNVAASRQTSSPTVAKVTFHVKDMGKRLNLL